MNDRLRFRCMNALGTTNWRGGQNLCRLTGRHAFDATRKLVVALPQGIVPGDNRLSAALASCVWAA